MGRTKYITIALHSAGTSTFSTPISQLGSNTKISNSYILIAHISDSSPPSLISLMVSVDVKHIVYLLIPTATLVPLEAKRDVKLIELAATCTLWARRRDCDQPCHRR